MCCLLGVFPSYITDILVPVSFYTMSPSAITQRQSPDQRRWTQLHSANKPLVRQLTIPPHTHLQTDKPSSQPPSHPCRSRRRHPPRLLSSRDHRRLTCWWSLLRCCCQLASPRSWNANRVSKLSLSCTRRRCLC